ncbi:PLAC8 motif-containing protein [Trypanosoma melophagium]|uniref:PLAC8 motif-containing protein n=1 Tax=Trypanosoma melophagium TaxID=715481 RepID=UPI00351A0293|nr:PLAC8 motif-containing protein [Trypanosoma melophagium]
MASKNTKTIENNNSSCGGAPAQYEPPTGTVVMPNTGPAPAQQYTAVPQYTAGGPQHGFPLNVPPSGPPVQPRDWHNGMCVCCGDCDSCLEAWCCYYCQLSRQYNLLYENRPEINWAVAMGTLLGDYCCGFLVSTVVQCMLRSKLRRSFTIDGTDFGDACASCCCSHCALQQSLLELTDAGLFPGACCYNRGPESRRME